MWVQFLGREDPLEEEMATHSGILSGKSHGQRSLAGYSPKSHSQTQLSAQTHKYTLGNISFSILVALFSWENLQVES